MSAQPAGVQGFLTPALARAQSYLLHPVEAAEEAGAMQLKARPVVLVIGLAGGCGATVVARALAAELAARDPSGTAAVHVERGDAVRALGNPTAGRLARTLANLGEVRPRPVGRLCIVEGAGPCALAEAVRYLAPLVLEPGHGRDWAGAAAVADHAVLVAGPGVEPALTEVVSGALAGATPRTHTVLNRAPIDESEDRWAGRVDVALPESRLGAQLALCGREPRGALGRAVRYLADRCEEPS